MTTYDNIHFHNCGELVQDPLRHGLRIQRVPESVRQQIDSRTRRTIVAGNGVELRFRMPQGWVNNEVILSSLHNTCVYVYHGDFKQAPGARFEVGSKPKTILVARQDRLAGLPKDRSVRHQFDPNLIRVVLEGGAGPVYFHGTTLPVEAPQPSDMPADTLLAYGTSITAGHHADIPSLQSFAAQTARALKCDHLNMGCSGTAFLDLAMADYMASLTFNRAVLCLSVNMISAGFSVEDFKQRASYLVNKLHAAQPDAHIACMSILPYFSDWDETHPRETVEGYRSALQAIVEFIDHPKVAYLHGLDMLQDLSGLTADMIHPNASGFSEIALNLVKHFKSVGA